MNKRLYFSVFFVALLLLASVGNSYAYKKIPQHFTDLAKELFEESRWGDGKVILDDGLKEYPLDPTINYLLGYYWWHARNYDRARYHLIKSVQQNNDMLDSKQLLVLLEEASGNYSSAICYVNELLEAAPYSKTLWLRKIELYRKQGNHMESYARLRRLNQIYPNDEDIRYKYLSMMEENYASSKRDGTLKNEAETLKEIVKLDPENIDYVLLAANAFMKEGNNQEALILLQGALKRFPDNIALLKKRADILIATNMPVTAVEELRAAMATNKSGELRALYLKTLAEAARLQNEADPYVLYSHLYGHNKGDRTALEYLLHTSVTRGYYDDALYYIEESRKRDGNSAKLAFLEYTMYKRMGDRIQAEILLAKIYKDYPEDYDISIEKNLIDADLAKNLMLYGNYAEAIPILEEILEHSKEADFRENAAIRLADCYFQENRIEKADALLSVLISKGLIPEQKATVKRAMLLNKRNNSEAALRVLQEAYKTSADSSDRKAYALAYEEIAMPFMKVNMEKGGSGKVLSVCETLLDMDQNNYWAIRYAANITWDKDREAASSYISKGRRYYPGDVFFKTKEALLLSNSGDKAQSLSILRGHLQEYPDNDELINAYAGISEEYSEELLNRNATQEALDVLDSALVRSPSSKSLLYAKGKVFEKRRQYDSSYIYLKHYVPSSLEAKEFSGQLVDIRNRAYYNTVEAGFQRFRFGDRYQIFGVGTLAYSRRCGRNTFTGRVNYTGRDVDTSDPGSGTVGRGLQGQLVWDRTFGDRWSGSVNLAGGNAYFPKIAAGISAVYHNKRDWDFDGNLGFRWLADKTLLYSLGLGVTKHIEDFSLNGKVDIGLLDERFFVNAAAKARYFPLPGKKTYVELSAGMGTAPEIELVDYYYRPEAFNRLNSSVGIGGGLLLTSNLSFEIGGFWSTLYMERWEKTLSGDIKPILQYRNIFNINAILSVSF